MRYNEAEPDQPSNDATRADDEPTEPHASCATLMNVGIEPDDYTTGVDWQNRGGDLPGFDEIVAVATEVDSAPDFSEQSALRLPRDTIGKAALHLEALLSQHPVVDEREDIARISRNGSGCASEPGTGDLSNKSTLFGNIDTCSFLRERLVEGCRTEADFVSYVTKLGLADQIARIRHGAGALQLRRAGENPFEGLSVKQCLSRGQLRLLIGHAELYLLNPSEYDVQLTAEGIPNCIGQCERRDKGRLEVGGRRTIYRSEVIAHVSVEKIG
jgi:hypothetical protein